MSLIIEKQEIDYPNPLDVVEELIDRHKWRFERSTRDDLHAEFDGRWCDYRLYFGWIVDMDAMQCVCHFDIKVPPAQLASVLKLVILANEKLWLGHFGYSGENSALYFRHTVPLRGVQEASVEQIEDLVDGAIEECERFYPAFQHVIWGGKDPAEALALVMLETVGEA